MTATQSPIRFEAADSRSDARRLDFIRDLYEEAFPPDERRDFEAILRLADAENPFRLYLLSVDGRPVGLLSYWEWEELLYVEHFAFDRSQRGGGYGRRTLETLIEEKQKPVVLEVEKPEDSISIRRIGFYERIGFRLWDGFTYIQPPYDATKRSLELYLMMHGPMEPTPERFAAVSDRLHREVYGVR